MITLFVLRLQQADKSWMFDMDNRMSKAQAEKAARENRINGGVLCQVWTEAEAEAAVAQSAPA